MKRLANASPELWGVIDISDFLYFTLKKCSQFSILLLTTQAESASAVVAHFWKCVWQLCVNAMDAVCCIFIVMT